MNMDTTSQFVVQIHEAIVIFAWFDIYIFADKFRYIFQWFMLSISLLDDNLMGDYVFSAIQKAVFPFFGNRQVVGDHISFAWL